MEVLYQCMIWAVGIPAARHTACSQQHRQQEADELDHRVRRIVRRELEAPIPIRQTCAKLGPLMRAQTGWNFGDRQ